MSRLLVPLATVILCSGFCFSDNISDNTLWKQIQYTGKRLQLVTSTSMVSSPQKCAEKCLCNPLCKSFGINTADMRCSLYDGRVWAGKDGTVESDWFYYWLLEASCPVQKGYKLNADKTVCYKYYDQLKLNWTAAQGRCEEDGGHLFLMDTQAKRSVLNELDGKSVYLGATDEFEEGVWNWLDGETVKPSDFNPGEPNNYKGKEHCLFKMGNGRFDDTGCSNHLNFICEVTLNLNL